MAFVADFTQAVVKAGLEVAETFIGARSLLTAAYQDVNLNEIGEKGNIVNIPVPGALTITNGAAEDPTFQALTSTKMALELTDLPSADFYISDWQKLLAAPNELKDNYVQPALAGIVNYANGKLGALLTAANYNSYSPVPHVTNNVVTDAQFTDARSTLREAKIPVDSVSDMSLVMGGKVYEKTMAQAEFRSADVRGADQAGQIMSTGVMIPTKGTKFLPDTNMPNPTISSQSVWVSALMHRYAMGVAFRPIPIPDVGSVTGSYINFMGIPVRFITSYDSKKKQWLFSLDVAMGFTVLRKECCILIYSNKV